MRLNDWASERWYKRFAEDLPDAVPDDGMPRLKFNDHIIRLNDVGAGLEKARLELLALLENLGAGEQGAEAVERLEATASLWGVFWGKEMLPGMLNGPSLET